MDSDTTGQNKIPPVWDFKLKVKFFLIQSASSAQKNAVLLVDIRGNS